MILIKVRQLSTLIDRTRGLIRVKKPTNVMMLTRFGIHTFGLNFPLDILILDSNKRIVTLRKNLKPNSFFVWNPIYNIVVECEPGTISRHNLKKGDIIDLHVVH